MLLTAHTSLSSTQQSNMWSFSSSLAINPAHVLTKERDKSIRNKSTRNRNVLNFCLVLATSGKFNEVTVLHSPEKTLYWSHLKQSLDKVIHEAESRAQWVRHSAVCTRRHAYISKFSTNLHHWKNTVKKNTVKHSIQSQLKECAGLTSKCTYLIMWRFGISKHKHPTL